MQIHLVIVQPDDYIHSLCFLDTADYLRYWLESSGVTVSMGKNRLRHDAVNIVFGAHLGFYQQWLSPRYCTFFFNLEQIGQGGMAPSPSYEALLRDGPVLDYHALNVASYRSQAHTVPLVPFLNAPYLNVPVESVDLANRPIDLLFFGSINSERRNFLKRVEKSGFDVAVFDSPTYYCERDHYVRQAKAVLNTSFYASARFEQVRAFNVLSQGTALINYLQHDQRPDPRFNEHVFWVDDANFDHFFNAEFSNSNWYAVAKQKYKQWCTTNPISELNHLLNHLQEQWKKHQSISKFVACPNQMIQAEDGSYYQDVLNLSPNEIDEADWMMDLCDERTWPWSGTSRWGLSFQVKPNQIKLIVLRRLPDGEKQWHGLLKNAIQILDFDGELRLELSLDQVESNSDFLSPKEKRILKEYSDEFWRAGLFFEKFTLKPGIFLNSENNVVDKSLAKKIIFIFCKKKTTTIERTMARVRSPDFSKQSESNLTSIRGD